MKHLIFVTILLSAEFSEASPLEIPDELYGRRSYIIYECPRAAAYSRIQKRQDSNLSASPEAIWNKRGSDNVESGIAWVAALAPPLIDGALDLFGNWVSNRAKGKSLENIWIASGFAAAPNPTKVGVGLVAGANEPGRSQCVILISGKFFESKSSNVPPGDDSTIVSGNWSGPWLSAFGLSAEPSFYAEIAMEYSPNYSAYRIAPRFIEFRKSNLKIGQNQKRHLSLAMAFSFNGGTSGIAAINLVTPLQVGILLTDRHLTGLRSQWIAVPPKPKDAPSNWLVGTPLSIQSTLIESVDGSEFDKAAAKLFTLIRPTVASKSKKFIESIAKDPTEYDVNE